MDDSIYRNFYWAYDQIEIWWTMAWPYLKSDTALRLYVLVGAIDALACTFVIAYFARLRLADMKAVALGHKLTGRPAKRADAVKRQLDKLRQMTISSLLPYARDFVLLLIFGLAVPSISLFLLAVHYAWLDIGGIPFVDLYEKKQVNAVNVHSLVFFIADQALHGALLDFPEIFDIDVGNVRNNPSDVVFSSIVFLFRTATTLFAAALGVAILDTLIVFRTLNKNDREKITAATSASGAV